MLAHTPCTLAPYARINIFLAIISISHARKNFKKNINIPLLKSSIAFCSLIRKRLTPKKRNVRTLQNQIETTFCKHKSCFDLQGVFYLITQIVFCKSFLQWENGDFSPFSAFLLNLATHIVFYVVLSKFDKIRFFLKIS